MKSKFSLSGVGFTLPKLFSKDILLPIRAREGRRMLVEEKELSSGLVAGLESWAASDLKGRASALYKVHMSADVLKIENVTLKSVSVDADITISGAGGLDTGSEAINTWYSIWVIYNPSLEEVNALLSISPDNPTMPANYTLKRRIGYVRNNADGNFYKFNQSNNLVLIEGAHSMNFTSGTDAWQTVNAVATIAPSARVALVLMRLIDSTSGIAYMECRPDANWPSTMVAEVGVVNEIGTNEVEIVMTASRTFQVRMSTTGGNFYVRRKGWIDQI